MTALFDLASDPFEDSNVCLEEPYIELVQSMIESCVNWNNSRIEPDIPPISANKNIAWERCGGLCPWREAEMSPRQIKQKYSYRSAPNIVFVLVDDWGFNDVGFRSSYLNWTTPHIDSLASEGVSLTNYFVHAICIPTRGALLTGRYAIRLGMWSTSEYAELPLTEFTLAEELKSAGYMTYMVGKWMQGNSSPSRLPTARGFDSFYGFYSGLIDYWDKTYFGVLDLQDNDIVVSNANELSKLYHTGYLFQSKAEQAISRHAKLSSESPMFLYYAMQLVHNPFTVPEVYLERCRAHSDSDSSTTDDIHYCGMVVMLDEALANLTCALEAYGMADNTIMIITSDNGGEYNISGGNYPFRGYKGTYYRGGISTTAIVHSKLLDESIRGTSYDGLVHVTDWLPTLMGLATGGSWTGSYVGNEIDGVDFWEAMITNSAPNRTEILHSLTNEGTCCYQRDSMKLHLEMAVESVYLPRRIFHHDAAPENAAIYCSSPSLVAGGLSVTAAQAIIRNIDAIGNYSQKTSRKLLFLILTVVIVTVVCLWWRRKNRRSKVVLREESREKSDDVVSRKYFDGSRPEELTRLI